MPPRLDVILDLLDEHHQRATYGAVAGVLGLTPRQDRVLETEQELREWMSARSSP